MLIGAHPDDCEIKAGGTAILWSRMGHNVKIVSVTNGDAGHMEQGGGVLAKRRIKEAGQVAKSLGATSQVLDNHDGELSPTLEVRKQIIKLIREWNADIVISHRPYDYHPDHRYVGELVQNAAFMVKVPNIVPNTPPLDKNPVFLYFKDQFTKPYPFSPDITVDITDVIDEKIDALCEYTSQFFEWLPWVNKLADKIPEENEVKKKWLLEHIAQNNRWSSNNDPSINENLIKWYGKERAEKVIYSESFEICEYGLHPDNEKIIELFPMLNK